MKAIWTGAIRFGLVYIPVKIYKATNSKELDLHLVAKNDMSRIRNRRVSEATGEEVPMEEIAHAYEYDKGQYVVLEQEDFRRASVEKTQLIDILSFTKAEDIDFKYLCKPFYLEPEPDGEKAYALLRDSMKETNKAAVVHFVLTTREHLGLLQPRDRVIVLEQMRFASEIKNPDELDLPRKDVVSSKEVRMGAKLIDLLSEPWNPERFHDTYSEDLMRLIERKAEGKTPLAEENLNYEIKDLFKTLNASVRQAEENQAGRRNRK